jgi:hypothetical protein
VLRRLRCSARKQTPGTLCHFGRARGQTTARGVGDGPRHDDLFSVFFVPKTKPPVRDLSCLPHLNCQTFLLTTWKSVLLLIIALTSCRKWRIFEANSEESPPFTPYLPFFPTHALERLYRNWKMFFIFD